MKKNTTKYYLNPKEFSNEVLDCLKNDKISQVFSDNINILIERISKHEKHISPDDLYDMKMTAWEQVLIHWKEFDIERSNNAFAWFSSVIYNGLKIGFKQLHPYSCKQRIQFVQINETYL